jgi:hypothetical protein
MKNKTFFEKQQQKKLLKNPKKIKNILIELKK